MDLSSLTVLNDQYAIRRTLGEPGPFFNTYMGWDGEREEPVIIREYFPVHLVQRAADGVEVEPFPDGSATLFRSGMKHFMKEGALLERIQHDHLPGERAPFREHGTAYRVSAYHEGTTLAEALEQREGSISEQAALAIMTPVLDALHAVHEEGLLHAGISPKSIYLARSRRSLLIGFHSAHVQMARKSDRLGEIIYPGMSPIEQYTADGRQGPWTDVYAAAATLYRAVAGELLPEATARLDDDPVPAILDDCRAFSKGTAEALLRALAIEPKRRVTSAKALQEMLSGRPAPQSSTRGATPLPRRRADSEKPPAAEKPSLEEKSVEEQAPPVTESAKSEAAKSEAARLRREAEAVAGMLSASESSPSGLESSEAGTDEPVEAQEPPKKRASGGDQNTASEPERVPERPGAQEDARVQEEEPERARAADRPAEPSPAAEESPAKARSIRMAALAIVLAVVVAGGGYTLLGGAAEGPSAMTQYANLRAEGDSLFRQAEYDAARARYMQAVTLQPAGTQEDGHVKKRLHRIDQLQAAARKARYEEHLRRAEDFEARAQAATGAEATDLYAEANKAYLSALDDQPGDSLAFAGAQRMNQLLAVAEGSISAQQISEAQGNRPAAEDDAQADGEQASGMREQLYAQYRRQGDALLETKEYSAARRKFREALDYRANDTYALEQLEKIDALLDEAERMRQYKEYMAKGDALVARKAYERAQREYELAQAARPDDRAVAVRLEKIDNLLADRKLRSQQYQYHRAQGDLFYEQVDFEAAIRSYEEALALRPDDEYARDRIEQAKKMAKRAESGEGEVSRMAENGGFYTVVDEQPKLIGGLAGLHKKVEYPERARRAGVEGRVVVQMIVTADGEVRNPQIVKGIGGGCDEEAVRVIKKAKFEPARLDGKAVPAQHSVWVQFRLEK